MTQYNIRLEAVAVKMETIDIPNREYLVMNFQRSVIIV